MLPGKEAEGKNEGRAQLFRSMAVDVQSLKNFCAQQAVTEMAFFNACFAYVLTKFTGLVSIKIGGYSLSAALQGQQPQLVMRELSWENGSI